MTGDPPVRIETCIPERREPGLTLFNIRPGSVAGREAPGGWVIGLDQAGEFEFCRAYTFGPQDTTALPNGNFLSSRSATDLITEMTLSGDIVRQWYAAGKWEDKEPPEGAIRIDLPLFHHRVNILANGNLLLLSMEIRRIENWPASDSDPDAGTETASVVGDVIAEVAPDGTIMNTWRMLDMLDPYRLCYGSRAAYWVRQGFPDTQDWCHANAVSHDARDDSILVSLRTQDCIVKFSRQTGELVWILGDPGNWKAPWSGKLLTPVGDLDWQYHQHDGTVTPSGTVLCFDNGNYRALPFVDKLPPEDNHSRVVEFEVDDAAMTVRQVWFWDGAQSAPGPVYACYQGGATRLPKTGNTLMTYGGIVTRDGAPIDIAEGGFCRARIVEIAPDGDIVLDLWVDGSADDMPLSVFRAEHYPKS